MKNEEKAKEIGNIMLELANCSSYNTPDENREIIFVMLQSGRL